MNKKIKSLLLFCVICCNSAVAISQQFIKLQGKIIDKHTTLPLPYANIGLTNSSYGTISNQKGEFQLVVPSILINEKVVFQFLGYKTVKIPVNECIEKNLNIKLSVLPVDLKPVNVKYRSPQDLIAAALNTVASNFLNSPVRLTSFYKEEVRENNEKIQFIEAVMQIYKGTYSDGRDKDRIKIVKAREQANLKSSVFFNYLYFVDGPYEALALDVAKYPKHFLKILHNSKNFLNPKHFRHYLYDFKEAVYDKDVDNQFVITFRPKSKKALLQGKVVLDKESLAFLSIEFWVPENRVANARLINYENEKYINSEGFYTKALNYHCKANFGKFNNRFVIKNSQIDYDFQFINAANNQIYEISNSIEFVVTKIDDKNVEKFKPLKSVWRNVSLSKQLGTYDPEFWENYNIIKQIDQND